MIYGLFKPVLNIFHSTNRPIKSSKETKMKEKPIHSQGIQTTPNNSNCPQIHDTLREDEMKFHQSQNHRHEYASSAAYSNPGTGFSRMKFNSMQDGFLNNCRHDRTVLEISLVDSTVETGVIVGFDVNTLIMETEEKFQYLIMKSAIIKIKPTKFVNYIFNDNYKYMNVLFDYSGEKGVGG